ncbi:nuclear transport factor 2 family protein [Rhabdobacter roseus]|uniref:Uncharacterized protein (TIGR02246 family) n=1 Tax=Rhabdobacter roseus TaxID=1655419 RepID=A0A840TGY2_9BACT|nr:nuclear transport factor 2 family protein [Rhabdobacter roseus]MBB5283406.1 uncharacterized protein (TIGR02246 family) [Rhabdobacter roseus]
MTEKAQLIQRFNEAYAQGDADYIIDQVTDDIVWTVIGEKPLRGKEAFAKATREMEGGTLSSFTIDHVITHGRTAAANGSMTMKDPSGEEKAYAFCDIYVFSGFKNAKIKEMTSYVIEVKP